MQATVANEGSRTLGLTLQATYTLKAKAFAPQQYYRPARQIGISIKLTTPHTAPSTREPSVNHFSRRPVIAAICSAARLPPSSPRARWGDRKQSPES